MKRKKESEAIRMAARHAAAAAELLMQLSALQSFREQELLDRDQVRDEVVVLVKQYVAETDKASALVKDFINRNTNGHSKS